MAFECNIDARGKAHRLRLGIIAVVGGILLGTTTFFDILPTTIGYVMAGGSVAGGLFSIWEARMGWCVVRAMGFRTKI